MTITSLTLATLVSLGSSAGGGAIAGHTTATIKKAPSTATGTAPVAKPGPEAALKEIDEKFLAAFNSKNADAVAALYAEDAVVMDPGPAMWLHGRQEVKKSFGEMFAGFETLQLTIHEGSYKLAGNLGYSSGLWHLQGKDKSGQLVDMSGRASSVYGKRGGKWVYIVDHASMPMPPPPAANGAVMPAKSAP